MVAIFNTFYYRLVKGLSQSLEESITCILNLGTLYLSLYGLQLIKKYDFTYFEVLGWK